MRVNVYEKIFFVHVERTKIKELTMTTLAHEKLDVYQCAIEFVSYTTKITQNLPESDVKLAQRLYALSVEIPINIVDAVSCSDNEKSKECYRKARKLAMESGVILDVFRVRKVVEDKIFYDGKSLLSRIISMLTKLVI